MVAAGERTWPSTLWIVRHAESAGNVARDAAYRAGLDRITLDVRDIDVPLSPRGQQQARALGRWFAQQPSDRRPTAIMPSPYLRAAETAELLYDAGGFDRQAIPLAYDERLREKEFGILDRFTRNGISQHFPEQADLRLLMGKFYHRPP